MTQTQDPSAVALVLRRTFDAPREAVFNAWSDPATMRQFMGGAQATCTGADVDLRTGGAYRIAMLMPSGEVYTAVGNYREVTPPQRLVCTWRWLEDDPTDEHETLLTVEFNEKGAQTEIVLTHENFESVESRDNHAKGWATILESLESALHQDASLALVIRRTFDASPEALFKAFTDPLMMRQWMGAQPRDCKEVALDLRPGGAFSVTMYGRDGEELTAGGVYREIVPGSRLVCTWGWMGAHAPDNVETLLTVEFHQAGEQTELVLTQERFLHPESRDMHIWGWNTALDKCEKLVA